MPKTKILQEGASYSFRSYFEMPYETDEILADLGYTFANTRLHLPTAQHLPERLADL